MEAKCLSCFKTTTFTLSLAQLVHILKDNFSFTSGKGIVEGKGLKIQLNDTQKIISNIQDTGNVYLFALSKESTIEQIVSGHFLT